jgi:hypothetical protein
LAGAVVPAQGLAELIGLGVGVGTAVGTGVAVPNFATLPAEALVLLRTVAPDPNTPFSASKAIGTPAANEKITAKDPKMANTLTKAMMRLGRLFTYTSYAANPSTHPHPLTPHS